MTYGLTHANRSKHVVRLCAWCQAEVPRWDYPPFCSMRCALKYARSAFRAGFRAPPKDQSDEQR